MVETLDLNEHTDRFIKLWSEIVHALGACTVVKGEINKWLLYFRKGGDSMVAGERPSIKELVQLETVRPDIDLIDEDA